MLITAPAFDFNGAFIGVIAFEVDMTSIYKLIQDTNRAWAIPERSLWERK